MAEGPKPVGHLTQFCKIPEMSRVIRITLKRDSKEAPVAGNRQRPAPPFAICKSRLTRSPLIRTVPASISSRLILRKDGPGTARWRIGDGTNIGDQRLDVCLAERVSPSRDRKS